MLQIRNINISRNQVLTTKLLLLVIIVITYKCPNIYITVTAIYYRYYNLLPLLQQSVVIPNEHNTCVLDPRNLCKFVTQILQVKPNVWSSTEM